MHNWRADERISVLLRTLYEQYGYLPYQVNRFEEYDLYMRNKRFLASEHVLAFNDLDGKLLALKPDVTLSVIKNTADDGDLRKLCYAERVYRVPRGGAGFREIMQTGLEWIGPLDAYGMAEVLTLAAKSLKSIHSEYALDVSDLRMVAGVLDEENLEENQRARLTACMEDKNLHELTALCETWGLGEKTIERLRNLVTVYGPFESVLEQLEGMDWPKACQSTLAELREIYSFIRPQNLKHINLDFSVMSDMNYYNGLVFQGFVSGIATSILSGGRYDNLMRRMGKHSPAMGFAVYMDQLPRLLKKELDFDVDYLIYYNDQSDMQAITEEAQSLRNMGMRVRIQREGEASFLRANIVAQR